MSGLKQSTLYSFLQPFSQQGSKGNVIRSQQPAECGIRGVRILSHTGRRYCIKTLDEITDWLNTGSNRNSSKQTIERKLQDDGYHKRTEKMR